MTYHGSSPAPIPQSIEHLKMRIEQLHADIFTLQDQLNATGDEYLAKRFYHMIEEKEDSILRAIRDYYDVLDPSAAQQEHRRAEYTRMKKNLDGIAEEIDHLADYFTGHEEDVLGAREGLKRGMRAASDRRVGVDTYMNANLQRSKRR